MTYEIQYDVPDGHSPMPGDNPFDGRTYDTLREAREALGSRIEGLERWEPTDIGEYAWAEGYYESDEVGCGSWVILGS